MAEKVDQAEPARREQQPNASPATNTGQSALIPERARRALTETRAAIKDVRAGLAKEFGTVTRDIMAALQKSAEGTVQTASASRIAESMRREGPVVETNETGLVTSVTYPDGTTRKFAYGEDGKLDQLTDKDGTIWRLRDRIWIQFAADGSVSGEIWEGTLSVDQAGVYHYEDPSDGSLVFERPDGSKLVQDPAGLKMEADEHGHVVSIQYPDGTFRNFQYAVDGSLNRVLDPDGSTWKTSDGLRWFQYNADGSKTGNVWFGKMSVDHAGSYIKEDAGTAEKIIEEPYGGRISEGADGTRLIQGPDGTVLVEKPDGTRLYTTADGTHISETPNGFKARKPCGAEIEADHARRITKITYPDMTMRNFKYDSSGSLVQIWDRDGTIWKKGSEKSWAQYKPDGKPTGQMRAGDISVDEQGDCIYLDSENSSAWIEQPDGCRVTESADGARIETSADGRTATYIAPGGRRFSVSTEGYLKYETREGDRLGAIASDAVIYRHFFAPGYTPTQDEVAQEKRRLSRITNVDDVRELPVGKTIMIKSRVETMTPEVMREVRQITRSMRVAVAESFTGSAKSESAPTVQESSQTPPQKRVPKDTAEMLLPWFSPDLDLSQESAQAPLAPPVDPAEFDLGTRDVAPAVQPQVAVGPTQPASVVAASTPAQKPPAPAQAPTARFAPWSSKPVAAKPVAPAEPPAPASAAVPPASTEPPAKRIAPWSSKPAPAKPEPAAEVPAKTATSRNTDVAAAPSEAPAKRGAPWSSKPAPTRPDNSALSVGAVGEPPAQQDAPGSAGVPPPPTTPSSDTKVKQAPAKRIAPWSSKPAATPVPAPSPIPAQPAVPSQSRINIELDDQGRVLKIEYADETFKEFEYDKDGQLVQFRQQNGRTTKKNDDSTWTSYARDGRQMQASGKASVLIDREGNVIWEYHTDGSASVQRPDGATAFMDSRGELSRFVSSTGRVFSVAEDGAMTYEVEDEDTIQDIADDGIRAWGWRISFCVPGEDERDEMVRLIATANNLEDTSRISEGDTLTIPQPEDIGVPQLNALQRSLLQMLLRARGSD